MAATGARAEGVLHVPVSVPLVCSGGPNFTYRAVVSMPTSAASGSTITVRIDSGFSEKLSHGGLNFMHHVVTDYVIPQGASYVDGSARVVAGTGTSNARVGARAWHDARGIHMALPARIDNGTEYSPPTLEFSLRVDGPPGTRLPLRFGHYEVTANVFLLGDLHMACDATPKVATMGELEVVSPSPERRPELE